MKKNALDLFFILLLIIGITNCQQSVDPSTDAGSAVTTTTEAPKQSDDPSEQPKETVITVDMTVDRMQDYFSEIRDFDAAYVIKIVDKNPNLGKIAEILSDNTACTVSLDLSQCDGLSVINDNIFGCDTSDDKKSTDDELPADKYYIQDGVSRGDDGTVKSFPNLISIVLPNSITDISAGAFSWCVGLTSITLPFVGLLGCDETADASDDADAENMKFHRIFGSSVLDVPRTLKSVSITGSKRICRDAFNGCAGLADLTLPGSIEYIYNNAFFGCRALKQVNYKGTLKQWCRIAFSGYGSNPTAYAHNLYIDGKLLTDLVIPDSVTDIKTHSFRGCSSLNSVTIHDNVRSIGNSAFDGCRGLTSLTIPGSVKKIERFAFMSCDNLTSLTIPFIGLSADATGEDAKFYSIFGAVHDVPSRLQTVVISGGDGISDITNDAFAGCSKLDNISIPETVTNIGARAFYGCSSLTDVVIPKGVTNIGEGAFLECQSLNSFRIPDKVTSIENATFADCNSLKNITIPAGVVNIGSGAFYNCIALTSIEIPDSVTTIGESAFSGCRGLTSITIPDGVSTIENTLFQKCSALETITIGRGVSQIYLSAFNYCVRLKSIIVDKDNPNYCDTDGVLYNKDKTVLIHYPMSRVAEEYTVPNGVTEIAECGLHCSALKKIVLPDSVTLIGDEAFAYCTILTSITINAATPPAVGAGLFSTDDIKYDIYVPAGSVDAYKSADGWSVYADRIKAIEG